MRRIFVDTSAWCAIEDGGDTHHEASLQFKDEIAGACGLVTTDYVLDETYTLLLLNLGYERTVAFHNRIEQLAQANILHIVQVSQLLGDEAWKVFAQFNIDKQWSFTSHKSADRENPQNRRAKTQFSVRH